MTDIEREDEYVEPPKNQRRVKDLHALTCLVKPILEAAPFHADAPVTLPRAVVNALVLHTIDLALLLIHEDENQATDPVPLARTHPALEKWRRLVLESTRPRTPLERAAAWEATALECAQLGALDEAKRAHAEARAAIAHAPSPRVA